MSQQPWNDLKPASALQPIVERGPQTLSVFAWTQKLGLPPHVVLRVGEETDSQRMQLTPLEARRIAVALLQAAENVESTK